MYGREAYRRTAVLGASSRRHSTTFRPAMTAPTTSGDLDASRARPMVGGTVRRVLAVVALARVTQFVEVVLFPLVAVQRGAGAAGGALVLLALAVGSTAGSVLGGYAVDRWGPRPVASVGLLTSAAGAAALAFAQSLALLASAAALYGLATAVWRLALEAATTHALAHDAASDDVDDHGSRERAFGAFVWLVNLGALASAVALAAGTGLRLTVAVQSLMMAAAALAAAGLLPHAHATARMGASAGRGFRDVPIHMWLLALAYAPLTMVMFQAFSGLAQIFDHSDYRTMILVNAVVLVAFPPLLWSIAASVHGLHAIVIAGTVQGVGIAAAAITRDPLLSTIVWSAGEATLIAIIPAIVAGIAPHAAAGHYRAAFATVQGAAAAIATFGGPLIARWSVDGFATASLILTAAGVTALVARRRFIAVGLEQPVACPCGASLCSCDASHIACAFPSPVVVHRAATAHDS